MNLPTAQDVLVYTEDTCVSPDHDPVMWRITGRSDMDPVSDYLFIEIESEEGDNLVLTKSNSFLDVNWEVRFRTRERHSVRHGTTWKAAIKSAWHGVAQIEEPKVTDNMVAFLEAQWPEFDWKEVTEEGFERLIIKSSGITLHIKQDGKWWQTRAFVTGSTSSTVSSCESWEKSFDDAIIRMIPALENRVTRSLEVLEKLLRNRGSL